MQATLYSSKSDPAYASLLTLKFAGFDFSKSAVLGSDDNLLVVAGQKFTNDASIAEAIARTCLPLVGNNVVEYAAIAEFVLLFKQYFDGKASLESVEAAVKPVLQKQDFLALNRVTVADLILFSIIAKEKKLQTVAPYSKLFNFLRDLPQIADVHRTVGLVEVSAKSKEAVKQTEDKGKFIELPGAEKGKVVVRFPPEASGYLHIGHAKAALLNAYYATEFEGRLILRFDDTNPAKENADFEAVIKEDLKMLGIESKTWTHSSDLFDKMLELCEKLLKEGKAFVDDTSTEQMREEREKRVDSKNRNNSVEKNLELWNEMKKGTARGQECCVRIKIDMSHNNGAMRDPTIYRCKAESHVRTGDKYKVYPTYDFACPIVDSTEGVTHALRTTEYHDRDDQYFFICDALGIRKPHIWEYARLNMTHTVMSKRKLTKLVDEGIVEGWDDPRLPTVRGIMRRGLTVEGLKQFIYAQGGSRSVVVMEWDKLWAFNKKIIDPIAPRYTALEGKLVTVKVNGQKPEDRQVNLHPKDEKIGAKSVHFGSTVLIEQFDADFMKEGDTVTFVNWGNVKVVKVERKDGHVQSMEVNLDLENKDFKKTYKTTWIAGPTVDVDIVRYDPVISKAVIGKDEDWMTYLNRDSKHVFNLKAEPAIKNVKKGEIIQFQRKLFFICDKDGSSGGKYSFIEIPDGHVKGANDEKKPEKNSKNVKTTNSTSNNAATPSTSSSDEAALYAAIEAQGNVVREQKTKDTKSQETKDAIAKLLDLKKQYKEKFGKDYKPGAAPAASAAPAPAADEASAYAAIAAQGNLVRELKKKDPKSQDAKDAITKLTDLKKQYKEKFGKEYKPDAPPATSAAPASAAQDDEASAYAAITAQGNVVREQKTKDAKSQETKDAIAKLLDLKKQYKAKFGKEYKPGAAPAASAAPAPAAENDEATAYAAITAQGNVVREQKSKDAKSKETKDAIAKLLDLKKQYKEKFGKEYKPDAPPATSTASAPATQDSETSAHAAVAAQGNLVRELKKKDAKSKEAQDAITKLKEMKQQYKEKFGKEYK